MAGNWRDAKIGVVGLGYVGLPLAVEFGRKRSVVGFDVDGERVQQLKAGFDRTAEVPDGELEQAHNLAFTTEPSALKECGIIIVTVPTPVDQANRPDLGPLRDASALVGAQMSPGTLVIYESTVFPGCTEDICMPILAAHSGLTANEDFYCGYSPERINPGDREHRLTSIVKVTSGSTPEAAEAVDRLYAGIVAAGTHKAGSIRVAEAAKVIENTQRDLNIALMNELAIIFNRLGIDTREVLEAAATKWNFLKFTPGLVGGHCIGVDPYYLTHKAQEVGYHPEVILAGRRINDRMGAVVSDRVIKAALSKGLPVAGAKALILGLTFKENCPDLRNTQVVDIVAALEGYNMQVDVYDPRVDPQEATALYGINCLTELPQQSAYSAIVLAVAHSEFVAMGATTIRKFGAPGAVFFDVKAAFGKDVSDGRL